MPSEWLAEGGELVGGELSSHEMIPAPKQTENNMRKKAKKTSEKKFVREE